jgi:hypothetical protein
MWRRITLGASSTTKTISTIVPATRSESVQRHLFGMPLNPQQKSRGDTRRAKYNRGPFDIATLAIFPEYLEFEGQEVLRLVVEGAAGRTVA